MSKEKQSSEKSSPKWAASVPLHTSTPSTILILRYINYFLLLLSPEHFHPIVQHVLPSSTGRTRSPVLVTCAASFARRAHLSAPPTTPPVLHTTLSCVPRPQHCLSRFQRLTGDLQRDIRWLGTAGSRPVWNCNYFFSGLPTPG